jgi:hypothetical protein
VAQNSFIAALPSGHADPLKLLVRELVGASPTAAAGVAVHSSGE